MNIASFLDSTYLKLPEAAGISESENQIILKNLVDEAAKRNIFAVMIRPQYVGEIKEYIMDNGYDVKLGTVIGFPEGTYSTENKIAEARKALMDGADELDFVFNYRAFVAGELDACAQEVQICNRLVLNCGKVAKWIIETAALNDEQIAQATSLIANSTLNDFSDMTERVFVKSSTGFYSSPAGEPNGATQHNIKIMLANAQGLPVKAAGGVRNTEEAEAMIQLGVKRIGTSAAAAIVDGEVADGRY